MMNAMMKVREYLQFFGVLPDVDDLRPHIYLAHAAKAAQYKALRADASISIRLRADWMYRDRFSLRPIDLDLIRAIDRPEAKAQHMDGKAAWGKDVRFSFAPLNMYSFTSPPQNRWMIVAEDKSLPGRDAPRPGPVIGRAVSSTWYERASGDDSAESDDLQDGESRFVPCVLDDGTLAISDISIGEMSLAAGYYPPDIVAEHTERDVECLHESRMMEHGIVHCESRHL